MKIPMLSCGIFKYELEAVRAEIERELGAELAARFLPPALDLDFVIMEAALREELDGAPTALLYGSMCHPQLGDIAAQVGADLPCRANCAAMFLPTERNAELAADGNVFFLTLGGLRHASAAWASVLSGFVSCFGWYALAYAPTAFVQPLFGKTAAAFPPFFVGIACSLLAWFVVYSLSRKRNNLEYIEK